MAALPSLAESYPLTDAQAEELRAAGHIVLRGVFSSGEVAAYAPVLRDYVAGKRERMSQRERDMGASPEEPNFDIGEAPASVADLVTAPRLGEIAARLLDVSAVRLLHFCGFFKPGGGSPTPWHQDLSFIPLDSDRVLSIWIPITDVSPDMGGLMFAGGSHRYGPLALPSALGRFEIASNGAMRAGDISIHMGWTLHASRRNASRSMREAISVCYYGDGARVAEGDQVLFRRRLSARYFAGLRPGDEAAGPMTPVVFRRGGAAPATGRGSGAAR
ncbi:phytanoyl-CoA dioxygenase family protein [Sorangium sp. So ce1182]|uniref:phytanoyl-CoA dioxygenase family protein n=1 Tax=Sorangium sp. So ce1182 TaxID=3133334 RepID=UPI003F5F1D75